jgi:hypothetical protein
MFSNRFGSEQLGRYDFAVLSFIDDYETDSQHSPCYSEKKLQKQEAKNFFATYFFLWHPEKNITKTRG